jgi:hypothetical protein
MSSDEITDYLTNNTNVCGDLKMNNWIRLLFKFKKMFYFLKFIFHKIFMLKTLLISMGTSLFSCQNSNGTKQKIGNGRNCEEQPVTLGIICLKDSINNKVERYQKQIKKRKFK